MPELRLEALREKLLRAGIAPRHVRRYMRELKQHCDDLVRDEMLRGLSPGEAHAAARARLGGEEELASAMLAQPELRSYSARYPWAVFGLSPILMVAVVLVAAVLLEIGVIKTHEWLTGVPMLGIASVWFKGLIVAWNKAMMYAVPFLLAVFFCVVGARQRLALGWIALAAVLSMVLGTIYSADTVFSNQKGMSEFNVGVGFSSNDWPRLLLNIALAGLMTVVCWVWKKREMAVAD